MQWINIIWCNKNWGGGFRPKTYYYSWINPILKTVNKLVNCATLFLDYKVEIKRGQTKIFLK